jgi:hypothetical protein
MFATLAQAMDRTSPAIASDQEKRPQAVAEIGVDAARRLDDDLEPAVRVRVRSREVPGLDREPRGGLLDRDPGEPAAHHFDPVPRAGGRRREPCHRADAGGDEQIEVESDETPAKPGGPTPTIVMRTPLRSSSRPTTFGATSAIRGIYRSSSLTRGGRYEQRTR